MVTPDGERSLNTYLGWSEHLGPEDIDEAMMADAEWIFLEGYRFDGPDSHAAFAKAIAATKGAGGKVSITLSDAFLKLVSNWLMSASVADSPLENFAKY